MPKQERTEELKKAICEFLDKLDDKDDVELMVERGKTETLDYKYMRTFKPNNTITITIKINGGARDKVVE